MKFVLELTAQQILEVRAYNYHEITLTPDQVLRILSSVMESFRSFWSQTNSQTSTPTSSPETPGQRSLLDCRIEKRIAETLRRLADIISDRLEYHPNSQPETRIPLRTIIASLQEMAVALDISQKSTEQ